MKNTESSEQPKSTHSNESETYEKNQDNSAFSAIDYPKDGIPFVLRKTENEKWIVTVGRNIVYEEKSAEEAMKAVEEHNYMISIALANIVNNKKTEENGN